MPIPMRGCCLCLCLALFVLLDFTHKRHKVVAPPSPALGHVLKQSRVASFLPLSIYRLRLWLPQFTCCLCLFSAYHAQMIIEVPHKNYLSSGSRACSCCRCHCHCCCLCCLLWLFNITLNAHNTLSNTRTHSHTYTHCPYDPLSFFVFRYFIKFVSSTQNI